MHLKDQIPLSWKEVLEEEWEKEYFQSLEKKLEEEYQNHTVFPPRDKIFQALELTPYQETKVVILGQDPYHGEGQAHGLAFSVPKDIPKPPSLKNIFREMIFEFSCPMPVYGTLTSWAKKGVLLLNTILTVRKGAPKSHKKLGWHNFTDKIMEVLNLREEPVVFALWGGEARKKKEKINLQKHAVVERSHPSPLSAHQGFLGTQPFTEINKKLMDFGYSPIPWTKL